MLRKLLTGFALLSLLPLAACKVIPPPGQTPGTGSTEFIDENAFEDDTENADESEDAEDAEESEDTSTSSVTSVTGGDANEEDVRVIEISAKNWEFSPSEIRVKKGEKVTLRITGTEGVHGFSVPDLGVNVSVSANQSVSVTLPTDKVGEFAFRCSIPCGPGHTGMTGTIIIEE